MAVNWYLNQALTNFRKEVNAAYPKRDKASDGTIGDPAHQARSSDHNPDSDGSVDAWDMDVDLNGVGKPYAADVERLKRLFEKHESSHYWIHNDQICFRSEGWKPRSYAYAGSSRNRHEKHVHFNTRESHERSTKPWGVTNKEEVLDATQDARLRNVESKIEYLHDLMSRWRGGMTHMSNGTTVIAPVDWRIRDEAEQKAARERDAALAKDIAGLKTAVADLAAAQKPEATAITDEQLERVLRKVVRSLGEAA